MMRCGARGYRTNPAEVFAWRRHAVGGPFRRPRRTAILTRPPPLPLLISVPTRPDTDPIDAAFDTCLAAPQGQSTAGMVECTGQAITARDKRLNEACQAAMKALGPKSRALPRTAQRQWLAFREAETAALGGPWREDRGNVVRVEAMGSQLSALKERVRELQLYAGDPP